MKPWRHPKKKQTLGPRRALSLALFLGLLVAGCASEPANPPPRYYPYSWYGYAPGWDPYWDSFEVWPYGPYSWCYACGYGYYGGYPGERHPWHHPGLGPPGPGWGRPPQGGTPHPYPRPAGPRPAPRPLPRPHPMPHFNRR
ncbi:MAG TPA: hypothetical protein VFA75_11360 [Nevskia sp.]|nr:hypothetical protein [Nevskia sp.]